MKFTVISVQSTMNKMRAYLIKDKRIEMKTQFIALIIALQGYVAFVAEIKVSINEGAHENRMNYCYNIM